MNHLVSQFTDTANSLPKHGSIHDSGFSMLSFVLESITLSLGDSDL